MDDTSQEGDKNIGAVREDLINTAVKFLQHPKVQKSSLEHQGAFLRRKGLSEKEITLAFERSTSLSALPSPVEQLPQQQFQTSPPQHTVVPIPGHYLPPATTRWGRFREILHNFAIVSGLIYGLYLLYKKYIAPFLFGSPKKRPALEESIRALDDSVTSSVNELRSQLRTVQSEVEKISEKQELRQGTHATNRQMQELKNEVISLKGLLLNRNQFTTTSLEPPSIPAWQLEGKGEAVRNKSESHATVSEPASIPAWQLEGKGEAVENKSEPAANNNGSDSSLEMIAD